MTKSPRLGAHPEAGGVRFGAFSDATEVELALVGEGGVVERTLPLERREHGHFELFVPGLRTGARYYFVVDGKRLPDPYARYLPEGVHGPAEVVSARHTPRHSPVSRPLREQIIYELHVGTFTTEGTFRAAVRELPKLVELGVTTIELMPVAAFAGERGWGYDGVALFAPHAAYGTPDELRELVDAAHGLGLGVLLDVVYNHFGPSGNYLSAYSERYFCKDVENAWGKAPCFSEPALRRLVLENARYWLEDFGFDGLRLDATHALFDDEEPHVLEELAEVAHSLSPPRVLIAEDERNCAELVSGRGLDALWADDFHHQVRVTLTGENHGYYGAYQPGASGLAEVINRGWLYVGQLSPLTSTPRGTPADALRAEAFVYCIQNHDQVGNRAFGDRLGAKVSWDAYRAASLLLLFLPMTPLLFMGQEWGVTSPFLYFTDHEPELGQLVSAGRRREFAAFPEFASSAAREAIPDPQALDTFQSSKLRWSERELPEHRATLDLYRAALSLRKTDPVLSNSGRGELLAEALDGVLIVHRWRGTQRRVLVMNTTQQPLGLSGLSPRLRLRQSVALLRSSEGTGSELLPQSAIVLGGEGNLAGLIEGES